MTLEFLEEAKAELIVSAVYFEDKEVGLGVRFRDEVARVCLSIKEDPLLWRERSGGYRRKNCPVFPYYIAFIIRDEKVIVTAVAHEKRKPDYWKGRA